MVVTAWPLQKGIGSPDGIWPILMYFSQCKGVQWLNGYFSVDEMILRVNRIGLPGLSGSHRKCLKKPRFSIFSGAYVAFWQQVPNNRTLPPVERSISVARR